MLRIRSPTWLEEACQLTSGPGDRQPSCCCAPHTPPGGLQGRSQSHRGVKEGGGMSIIYKSEISLQTVFLLRAWRLYLLCTQKSWWKVFKGTWLRGVYQGRLSVIRGVGDSPYRWWWGVVFQIWISPRIRSQNRNGSNGTVRDPCRTDFCKNIGIPVHCYVPFIEHKNSLSTVYLSSLFLKDLWE